MRRAAWTIVVVILVVLGVRACQTINALEAGADRLRTLQQP